MKIFVPILTIWIFSCYSVYAQKLYVWCPEKTTAKVRSGFLDSQRIDIAILDSRTLSPESKVECQADEVVESLFSYIKTAYPSAQINLLDSTGYYRKTESGIITLKVAISAYHAGFGSDVTVGIGNVGGNLTYGLIPKGEWVGLTGLHVQLFDNRKSEPKKYQKEISEITSKPNMMGYKTAKGCLNASYTKACQSLLLFIDSSLLE